DAPTSVPLMISAGLPSTNPVEATARPVNELSSEITTGMSAPPIGITIMTPNTEATANSAENSGLPPPTKPSATMMPTTARNSAPLMNFWTGEVIAFSEITPCSLAHATTEPQNEIAPITQPN